MSDKLPSPDEITRQVDELLLPALVLGLVNIRGPIEEGHMQKTFFAAYSLHYET